MGLEPCIGSMGFRWGVYLALGSLITTASFCGVVQRDLVSQVNIDAPWRLLQFALQDAIASNSGTMVELSLKRRRSLVSASSVELVGRPQRMQTVSRVENPTATLIKNVAEAAEDVRTVKSSGSAFDLLGCAMNPSYGNNQLEDHYQHQERSQLLYLQRDNYGVPYC